MKRHEPGWALVFGGAGGIGWASAQALLASGRYAELVTVDVVRAPGPGPSEHLLADLGQEAERARLADRLATRPGRLAALVWAAGVTEPVGAGVEAWAVWRRIIEVDFVATAHLLCTLHERVVRDAAAVVVVDSTAADVGSRVSPPYGAAKAACRTLTRSLACLVGDSGARYNSLAPGPIETPLGSRLAERLGTTQQLFGDRTIAKRLGQPGEVAAAVDFLCGPGASFVNGTVLVVDGGYLAG